MRVTYLVSRMTVSRLYDAFLLYLSWCCPVHPPMRETYVAHTVSLLCHASTIFLEWSTGGPVRPANYQTRAES